MNVFFQQDKRERETCDMPVCQLLGQSAKTSLQGIHNELHTAHITICAKIHSKILESSVKLNCCLLQCCAQL